MCIRDRVETEQVFLVFARTYADGGAFQGRGIAVRHQARVIIETVRRGRGILLGKVAILFIYSLILFIVARGGIEPPFQE